jgi:hypothetical protein
MSLSDDLAVRGRWELPDFVLDPENFVLIWVDDDEDQGPFHANFGLDWRGEEIGLFDLAQKGYHPIDTYAFGVQAVDISMGRLPDGGSQWVFYASPTPGYSNEPSTGVDDPTAIQPVTPLPLAIEPPVPNPFNPSTLVRFTLPSRAPATLAVYDLQGRLVRILEQGTLDPGTYERRWDGRTGRGGEASSGVYWLRLDTGEGTRVTRAILIR